MVANRIRNLLEQRKMTQLELSKQIGMTRNGLNLSLKNDDFKTSVLEKIADALGVPIGYFFDDTAVIDIDSGKKIIGSHNNIGSVIKNANNKVSANETEFEVLKKENEFLKERLKDKNERINELKEMIGHYKQIIDNYMKK